jgi:hypothetical protein
MAHRSVADDESISGSTHGLLSPEGDFDLESVLNDMDQEWAEASSLPGSEVARVVPGQGKPQDQDQGQVPAGTSPTVVLGNDTPVPINRVPTSGRDSLYAVAFWVHVLLVVLLSFFESAALKSSLSLITYGKAGSWSSMLMIVSLLGAFIGCVLIFLLANWEHRERLMHATLPLSILSQVVLGAILISSKNRYSPLAIIIFMSALVDTFKYSRARAGVPFTTAVLNIVIGILNKYGMILVITCVCIVLAQTVILLWWGSFFVGLISSVHEAYADVLVVVMLASLYWTQQAFQALIFYIVGGCTLWYFVKSPQEDLRPQWRVMLHLQGGLTSGFGTVCKGALYSNVAMCVLEVHDWSRRETEGGKFAGCLAVLRRFAGMTVKPLLSYAKCYHRLAFCMAATYGRTFTRSAQDQSSSHGETLDIAIEDTTTHVLSAISKLVPASLAILFGLLLDRDATRSWTLFLIVGFLLAYSGLSLTMSIYRSGVDALIVAFGEKPEFLAKENQIVFSRFLRLMERQD